MLGKESYGDLVEKKNFRRIFIILNFNMAIYYQKLLGLDEGKRVFVSAAVSLFGVVKKKMLRRVYAILIVIS